MLSLVLGSEITDASVAAIGSSYPNLELLDLSGYVPSLILITVNCSIGVLEFCILETNKKPVELNNTLHKYKGKSIQNLHFKYAFVFLNLYVYIF